MRHTLADHVGFFSRDKNLKELATALHGSRIDETAANVLGLQLKPSKRSMEKKLKTAAVKPKPSKSLADDFDKLFLADPSEVSNKRVRVSSPIAVSTESDEGDEAMPAKKPVKKTPIRRAKLDSSKVADFEDAEVTEETVDREQDLAKEKEEKETDQ
ncbi:uncharacterized protein IL334_002849 [Kwoniella shivajii]|uniref:Uncharacterized protein n=1 Tax=Kwoniella shivajii TaxID=564305 RepID=A0ABZ1CVW8_9TREE|nr:hypothetical protein IL334_002849 [Kwoniella shivajii]